MGASSRSFLRPLTNVRTPCSGPLFAMCCFRSRTVRRLYKAISQREGAGFVVRRSIGSPHLNVLDPFLLLDHFGPTQYAPGEAVGAPDHPHRGFETVTYMLEGTFHHKDNAGNEGWLGPGWAQWMTAGSGIIHSEMPSDEILEKGGRLEGFQLWVNLPAKDKMIKPRYQVRCVAATLQQPGTDEGPGRTNVACLSICVCCITLV